MSQYGARGHYAVARILHANNALEQLFTDICAVRGWPRLLSAVPRALRPAPVERLCSRIPHGIPRSRVTAFTRFGWNMNAEFRRVKSTEDSYAAFLKMGRTLSGLVIQHGIGRANGLYAFNGEALELLQFCRARGMRTVLEQTIAPKEIEIELLRQEAELHPDWSNGSQCDKLLPDFVARQRAEWQAADLIVCGSDFVRNGIRAVGATNAEVGVVPYGVDSSFNIIDRRPHPGPLRVLTVGTVNTRKGIPYVYEAARRLKGKAEFRVVGSIQVPEPALRRLSAYVDVVSRVPRSAIVEHYRWADVFLLPSICEGSAMVCYEALAAGLPVLATPNTGAVIRDGVDGFLFAIRDVVRMVERIEQCASEPDLLYDLSRNARATGAQYNLKTYASNLTPLLLAGTRELAQNPSHEIPLGCTGAPTRTLNATDQESQVLS